MTLYLISRGFGVVSGLLILAGYIFNIIYGFNSVVGEYFLGAAVLALLGAFTGFLIEFRREFHFRQSSRS